MTGTNPLPVPLRLAHVFMQTGRSNLHTELYKKPKTLTVFHPSKGIFSEKEKKKDKKLHTWVKEQDKEIGIINLDSFGGKDGGCHHQTDDVGNGQGADVDDACWE